MKTRACLLATTVLITGGLGAAGLVPSALAAHAKPVCNLVVDSKGDATYNNVPGADSDDIVSADVASDGVTVTGVVRVAALTTPDPQAPLGRAFFAEFTAPGSADVLFLSARTYPQGTQFVYGYRGVDPTSGINTSYTLGTATGVVDAAQSEVRISAPIKGFVDGAKAKLFRGSKLTGLTATTWRMAGQGAVPSQSVGGVRVPLGGLLLPFDDATGTGSYTLGTPSCVAVGK